MSALHSAAGHASHEIAVEYQVDDHHWDHENGSSGQYQVPGGGCSAGGFQPHDTDHQRHALGISHGEYHGQHVIIPAAAEGQDAYGSNQRLA